ncbi:MAG: hypothetical protein GY729_12525 [Desulfobacteraceae bacterium]|nr:hypothetical protein [Desulfobacteraceae bacterium]
MSKTIRDQNHIILLIALVAIIYFINFKLSDVNASIKKWPVEGKQTSIKAVELADPKNIPLVHAGSKAKKTSYEVLENLDKAFAPPPKPVPKPQPVAVIPKAKEPAPVQEIKDPPKPKPKPKPNYLKIVAKKIRVQGISDTGAFIMNRFIPVNEKLTDYPIRQETNAHKYITLAKVCPKNMTITLSHRGKKKTIKVEH